MREGTGRFARGGREAVQPDEVETGTRPSSRGGGRPRCPYCHDGFETLVVARCWACRTPHHSRCIAEHGGCSIFGCEGGPCAPAARRRIVVGPLLSYDDDAVARAAQDRARSWSERQRATTRADAVLLAIPALLALVAAIGFGFPVLPWAAGAFLLLCAKDVAWPSDEIGWALRALQLLTGNWNDV